MSPQQTQAILVLPHLRIQNANAIGSPLTHGFPSITAFTGVMWALQRKLAHMIGEMHSIMGKLGMSAKVSP